MYHGNYVCMRGGYVNDTWYSCHLCVMYACVMVMLLIHDNHVTSISVMSHMRHVTGNDTYHFATERERERTREREKERKRESAHASKRASKRASEQAKASEQARASVCGQCVCVCVYEREGERETERTTREDMCSSSHGTEQAGVPAQKEVPRVGL